jgi:capsular polysaccharide biosynthesis protein
VVAQKMVTALAQELTRRLNLEKDDPDSMKFATEYAKIYNEPVLNPNQRPSSPNKPLNMIISLLLGVIVGVVFVILKEQFSNTFQTQRDVENTLGLPVIALVPVAGSGGEELE